MIPSDSTVSDKRITNSESQSSYYTGAVFIYGFLIFIALITVFNIFNSMNASVASRTRQEHHNTNSKRAGHKEYILFAGQCMENSHAGFNVEQLCICSPFILRKL